MGREQSQEQNGENNGENNGSENQEVQLPEGWQAIFPDMTPEEAKQAVENSRKWERRSKENAEAARRLAEIEEANKTEAERNAERIAAAEKRAEELEAKYASARVASAEGVPLEILAGPETRDEDGLKAFAKALKEWAGKTDRQGPPRADREGHRPEGSTSNKEAVARQLLGLDQ